MAGSSLDRFLFTRSPNGRGCLAPIGYWNTPTSDLPRASLFEASYFSFGSCGHPNSGSESCPCPNRRRPVCTGHWHKLSDEMGFRDMCPRPARTTILVSGIFVWIFFNPKKERKKTDNPREGWEDGTPPPHRDFKERSVVLAVAHRPLVYHFLSLFAVSHQFSQRPSCHLSFFSLSSSFYPLLFHPLTFIALLGLVLRRRCRLPCSRCFSRRSA